MTALQPLLHDLIPTLRAPSQAWSGRDGQIRPAGAQGVYHADVRVLSAAVVAMDGAEPEPIGFSPTGTGRSESTGLLRMVDGPGPDPTALLRRRREVTAGQMTEELEVSCATAEPVAGTLTVRITSDLAAMEQIKQGLPTAALAGERTAEGLRWGAGDAVVEVTAPGARITLDAEGATLAWDVTAASGAPIAVTWQVCSEVPAVVDAPADTAPVWSAPTVQSDDSRLALLVGRSLADLEGLRMRTDFAPDESFLAAGAPWFFTLFGRDSLWAARMLLPLGTDIARGTLRTLAARQGTEHVVATAEEPGKILHEIRAGHLDIGDGTVLPPVYYGTVDATSLWVCVLGEAARWGMADDDVAELLPAMERALAWMRDHGDHDGDGFLDYVDESGSGLSNQGWKDSGDSIQWRDGTLAEGPIALSEVQAYAYEAAIAGADLLDAFGRPGADEWRAWAARLKERFRARFWLTDAEGPYVAIALDRHGRAVDTVTSNMGHLLGTGLLDPDEEKLVARRLVTPDMRSGYGLRTLSTESGGFWPLSYHGGSAWTHDTAIAVLGLAKAGCAEEAGILIRDLLEAAPHFDFQMPELFGGNSADDSGAPLPYPASCHPQAWAGASSVAMLTAALGLTPSDDGLQARPISPSPVGALRVDGLVHGGRPVSVAVDADGTVLTD